MRSGKAFEEMALIYATPSAGFSTHRQCKVAELMVRAHDFGRIDREVKIEKVVQAGISALRNGLDHELGQHLPLGYEEHILYEKECEPLKLELTNKQLRAMTGVMFEVMQAMHEAWVREHLSDLVESAEARGLDDRFKRRFVPLELLGWSLARWHYAAALKLLGEVEPLMDEVLMIDTYEKRTQVFCRQNGIRDTNTIQQKIMEGAKFFPALSGRAEELMAREQNAMRIARSIINSEVVVRS